MASLADAFNYDELRDFDKRVKAVTPFATYLCELKIDGLSAEITAVYSRGTGNDSYTGTVIMTGYSESSNSEDDATYTADFKVTGAFTKVVVQNGSNPQ